MTWKVAGAIGGYEVNPITMEDHDRAQDWIWDFKQRYPKRSVVMMLDARIKDIEYVVYFDNEPDAIFNNMHEAEAWVRVRTAKLDWLDEPMVRIESRLPLGFEEEPPKPILNLWERLARDED